MGGRGAISSPRFFVYEPVVWLLVTTSPFQDLERGAERLQSPHVSFRGCQLAMPQNFLHLHHGGIVLRENGRREVSNRMAAEGRNASQQAQRARKATIFQVRLALHSSCGLGKDIDTRAGVSVVCSTMDLCT